MTRLIGLLVKLFVLPFIATFWLVISTKWDVILTMDFVAAVAIPTEWH
jgi:hypothetical protein